MKHHLQTHTAGKHGDGFPCAKCGTKFKWPTFLSMHKQLGCTLLGKDQSNEQTPADDSVSPAKSDSSNLAENSCSANPAQAQNMNSGDTVASSAKPRT